MENVKAVSAGELYTMVILNDDSLWAFGHNGTGQLGDGTTTRRLTPVKIMDDVKSVSAGYEHTMIIKTDGSLWACGLNSVGTAFGNGDTQTTRHYTPIKIMDDVSAVSVGYHFTMILKTDGSLWITGRNNYGQHGSGSTSVIPAARKAMDDVIMINAGYDYSIIMKADGSILGTGDNRVGQLGDGTAERRNVFVRMLD
jgi:alpha-tubulin suppressor-like RCC1 family protein